MKWFALSVGAVSLLTACLIPEKFEAKIDIKSDGSYSFAYDGTLALGIALDAVEKGKLDAKTEADLQKMIVELKKDPAFKKVEYIGRARYKVQVEKLGKAGETYHFISRESKIISITPQKDGTVVISAMKLDRKLIDQLAALGSKIDGSLSVSLGSGVKVVSHNASSEPSLFGMLGSYKWSIKSPDQVPSMVVKFK